MEIVVKQYHHGDTEYQSNFNAKDFEDWLNGVIAEEGLKLLSVINGFRSYIAIFEKNKWK
jgi:hypothetical protein